MAILFDPENGQTMVYCDSPDDCEVHCALGFRIEAGFFLLQWHNQDYDFCSAECMLDWILEVPPLEEYEDDDE